MASHIKSTIHSIFKSNFFKDSSWAVFGNGIGYGLMLLSGIIIARMLGKDLYGEYGFVKTTMFQFAAFATLGLGYSSTKFVAESKEKQKADIDSIVKASIDITTVASASIALLLIVFATPLSTFLNAPSLASTFQALGLLIIVRAISTTQYGILAGFGDFKRIAYSNTLSGVVMIVGCIPLTCYLGITGSLTTLVCSQVVAAAYNAYCINCHAHYSLFKTRSRHSWTIAKFSLPIALQEFTFALSKWLGILIITKYATLGEVGIYTASELWYAVILTVPTFLSNVILSHLSALGDDYNKHKKSVNVMIGVNVCCTIVPLIAVYIATPLILNIYGPSFTGMEPVLKISVMTTLFTCCSNVLTSELIALGKTWTLFTIRFIRDLSMVVTGFIVIRGNDGQYAARDYATITLTYTAIFFIVIYIISQYYINKKSKITQSSKNA